MKRKAMRPPSIVEVGRYTYGTEFANCLEWGEKAEVRIGSFCSIAAGTTFILGGNHRTDWISTFPFVDVGAVPNPGHPATNGDVTIGHDVWIAHGVTIMSGVSIGHGAVVAANSHVVRDVEPYEIVGGNPARLIRARFSKEIVDLLLALAWWELSLDIIKQISKDLTSPPTVELLRSLKARYRGHI